MSQPSTVTLKTKLAILSVGLLSFVGILVETSMNVTFPTLIKTMRVSLDTVQWLTTGYLLLTTIVMSTTAYVLKRFNPQALILICRPRVSAWGPSLLVSAEFLRIINWPPFTGRSHWDFDSTDVPVDFHLRPSQSTRNLYRFS